MQCIRPYPLLLWLLSAVLLALPWSSPVRAADAPVATIRVSSATAGGSLGGHLVEGVMSFRGHDYILTLRGVAQSVTAVGSVSGLLRPEDIEGIFEPTDKGLRNADGVTIRFDPPLSLEKGRLEIEVSRGVKPKVSGGEPGSGVE